MRKDGIRGAVLSVVLIVGACATVDAPAPVKYSGGIMVSSAGMTLYTFDKDPAGSGKSVCNGPCAVNWPPLTARGDARAGGEFTIIARDDGSRQWAYKGKPLYLWIKDQQPGERTGDGFNKVWRVVPRESGRMRSGYY